MIYHENSLQVMYNSHGGHPLRDISFLQQLLAPGRKVSRKQRVQYAMCKLAPMG